MKSLLDKCRDDWKFYTVPAGLQYFLAKLHKKYSNEDYYTLFGVSKNIYFADNISKVKLDYKQLGLIIHPDKVHHDCEQEATSLFKLVNGAYATLSDESLDTNYRSLLVNSQPTPPAKSAPTENVNTNNRYYPANKGYSAPTENANNMYYPANKSHPAYSYRNEYGQSNQAYTPSRNKLFQQKIFHLYKRDISESEHIQTIDEDITINGNVKGRVSSRKGNILINGNVSGNVESETGSIDIFGSLIGGSVTNNKGNIYVKDNIKNATIKNNSGKNTLNGLIDKSSVKIVKDINSHRSEGCAGNVTDTSTFPKAKDNGARNPFSL